MTKSQDFPYPRRRLLRSVVSRVTRAIFSVISDFRVIDFENFPTEGPLLVVANHFSFLDPVAVVSIAPWPIEFVGGFRVPNAPPMVGWLRHLWGYYPVYRGTGSQTAFRATKAILAQNGIMGIFPEGTSAHHFLRPPRPGAAFMAVRSRTRILPMGMSGLTEVFPTLRRGQRAKVRIRVGEPFGPFEAPGRGRQRRERLNEIGDEIMQRIANLLPAHERGFYSENPAIREAVEDVDFYPWDEQAEA
jgi:1-acyl-sn-glycerol-3-phosphate acyltransferase